MTHMPAKCFVIAALLVAVWLGPARTANAQGATCTPTASEGCLKVTLTGDHKAGASVCVFNDEERKSDQQVGATQTTGADGTTRFKLPPGRYWGRAHKSGHGKSDPGGLQPVPTGGVQVSANVTVTPASFSLMTGYTSTCRSASGSTSSVAPAPVTTATPLSTPGTVFQPPPPPDPLAAKRAEATRKTQELREYWSIYRHPRCTNCHGGVNPVSGTGGHVQTSQACSSCHSSPNYPAGWVLASANARFADRTVQQICNTIRTSGFLASEITWRNHVTEDKLIEWAFSPKNKNGQALSKPPRDFQWFGQKSLDLYDPATKTLFCPSTL